MNLQSYDSFYKKVKEYLFNYDLLSTKELDAPTIDEILEFEKANNIKFDDSIIAYLNNFGPLFRKQLKFKSFYSFNLNSINRTITEGEKSKIHQQILMNQHHEIDSRCEINLDRSLGKIIPLTYALHSNCFTFVEQGIDNPTIFSIFSTSPNDEENNLFYFIVVFFIHIIA